MNQAELEQLIKRAAAGEIDSLTAREMDALAQALDASPGQASRLADLTPPRLDLPAPPPVRDEQWDRMWDRIEAAQPEQPRARRWRIGWAQPLIAVAACLLALFAWTQMVDHATQPWQLPAASDVQIHSLEASDETFVAAGGDGPTIIWVLDES